MKQYNLGPNGGILTAANLFATRFDQARAQPFARTALISPSPLPCNVPGPCLVPNAVSLC